MAISLDTVDAYRRDGVVVLRDVFHNKWIEKLRSGLASNMKTPGKYRREYGKNGKRGAFFGDYCNWRRIKDYEDFVRRSPAAEIARTLMQSAKVNLVLI